MSAFIIVNAKGAQPRPEFLLYALTRSQWAFVHAVSSMLFSGTIVLSALLEYLVVKSKKASVIRFWFTSLPQQLDAKVVLPALTAAIVSGMGQAAISYGGLATSPKHVVGAFHLLLTFGLWWAITDVTSQRKAVEAVNSMSTNESDEVLDIPKVLDLRIVSGAVSCLLVVLMYALMVLKPGLS